MFRPAPIYPPDRIRTLVARIAADLRAINGNRIKLLATLLATAVDASDLEQWLSKAATESGVYASVLKEAPRALVGFDHLVKYLFETFPAGRLRANAIFLAAHELNAEGEKQAATH